MPFDLSKLRTGHAAGQGSSLVRRILNIADLPDIKFGHLVPEHNETAKRLLNIGDLPDIHFGHLVPENATVAEDVHARAFDISKLRFGRPGGPGAASALVRRGGVGSGPGQLPIGLIIAFVAAGIAALLMIFLVVVPFFERRKEKSRIAREGKPGDVEAPAPADVQFTRSGSNLLPLAPGPVMQESRGQGGLTVQMAPRPSQDFTNVSLVTPVSRPKGPNPFSDPVPEERDVGKEVMMGKEEDPFADEVAAMQERLKEKFQIAQGQYKA